MNTLFDKGEVIEYSASRSGDCYTIELTDKKNQHTRVYMSTDSLREANVSLYKHTMKIDV